MSVPQIIDEVFADYAGQDTLAPAWHWALADTSKYDSPPSGGRRKS